MKIAESFILKVAHNFDNSLQTFQHSSDDNIVKSHEIVS